MRPRSLATALLLCILIGSAPAFAANSSMKEGIAAYKAGDYKTAIGHLGSALSTEFNNPVLHYYLANCYVNLKETESAIREFRIAYALSPDNEVGKFSKDVLGYLGAPVEVKKEPKPEKSKARQPKLDLPKSDPIMDQVLEKLRKQTSESRAYEIQADELISRRENERSQSMLDSTKDDIMRNNYRYTRRGRAIQMPMPTDSQRMLDSMKNQFDRQQQSRKRGTSQKIQDLQRSAENLEQLLNERHSSGGVRLVPAGTNLYIRNYEPGEPLVPQF
ncbi:MAG: tetratricopeptide repeat protein [Candidatus Obscuribacterales bacterium]|nr:tetratricopeptide repeat protein [Candidatus Obscuribacterales bacterium]